MRWSELIQRGVRSAIQIRARFSRLLVRPLWIRGAFSKRLMRRTSVRHVGFACSQKSIIGLAIFRSSESQFGAKGRRQAMHWGKLRIN